MKLLDELELDAKFVKAGMDEALGGKFDFWKYIFERVDGRLPKEGPEQIDIGELVALAEARAEKRRLEVALMDRKVKLADKALEGPDDQVDLETIAREMVARRAMRGQPADAAVTSASEVAGSGLERPVEYTDQVPMIRPKPQPIPEPEPPPTPDSDVWAAWWAGLESNERGPRHGH